MKNLFFLGLILWLFSPSVLHAKDGISLTLIPPSTITNKVDLDIRAGLRNEEERSKVVEVRIYLQEEKSESLLHFSKKRNTSR